MNIVVVGLLLLSLITLVAAPVSAEGEEIYPTDETGSRRSEFLQHHLIYFDVFDGDETEYRVRLRDENEDIVHQRSIETDDDGNYVSSDHDVFLNHDGVGEYYLELHDPGAGETLYSHDLVVYEDQDFTQESSIHTYDEDWEEKNNFAESEWIYFEGRIRDQYGHLPEEYIPEVNIYVEIEDEDRRPITRGRVDEDGKVTGEFRAWHLEGPGDYTLMMYDAADEVEFATHTFTIIGIGIDIEDEYTQGQEMEIRIESNVGQAVDITIEDDTGEDIEDAGWTDQEFENDLWVEEYTIPDDVPDGTYYVVVYSTEGEELDRENFELKKYSLEATAEKDAYLPGDTVGVRYTVERLLDGSKAKNLDTVEYRIIYEDKEGDTNIEDSEEIPYDAHFEFDIPDDVEVPSRLGIDLWANGTEDNHPNHQQMSIDVGELNAIVRTDEEEYLQGQTMYVVTETYVSGPEAVSSVEDAQVTVDLKREGEFIEGYQSTARTDDSGEVVIPIHLSADISPGYYAVNVTAEKLDMVAYPSEEEIEIKEDIKNLNILLDREKDSYSPGENVNISYVVTKGGNSVEANVRYEVVRGFHSPWYQETRQVYEKKYATDGTIEFDVPQNFNQDKELYLRVSAKLDQETTGHTWMEIPVFENELILNGDQNEYEGGETIGFEYELTRDDQTTSEIYKVIEEPDDQSDIIEMNEASDNQFDFQVPTHPAATYEVRLEVITADGVYLEESIELRRVSRLQLEISIETDSSYTTDVHEPGDEIEIRYKIRAVGDANIPEKITLRYFFMATGQGERIQTDTPEGTFTVEIPEVSDGNYFLSVIREGTQPQPRVYSQGMEVISVEEDPSALSLRIFGGLSLLGLLGIIILLIILGLGYYSLSSYSAGIGSPKVSDLSKKEEGEEIKESSLEPDEGSEKVSPAEEMHAWKGPEEKERGEPGEVEGPEDSDQIEPDEDI